MGVDMSALERQVQEYALAKVADLASAFRDAVRANAPRRIGTLSESVEVDSIEATPTGARARVIVSAPYGRFVNDGTGIYGPLGTPIVPTSHTYLKFPALIGGGVVFARSVKGSEPTHFWERALDRWPDIVSAL